MSKYVTTTPVTVGNKWDIGILSVITLLFE
jgi:hypothetical protein